MQALCQLLFTLTFLIGVCITTIVQGATRIALVDVAERQIDDNLIALAEVKLSALPDVQIIERRQIDKALKEQALAGFMDAQHAVMLGKLLSADVMVAIEPSADGKQASGIVAFDAATGIRFIDQSVACEGAEQQAQWIADAVKQAATKRGEIGKSVRTASLLAVRNADLPEEMDGFCETIATLVQRQLLLSKDMAILERERLAAVDREKGIVADRPAAKLLASFNLIQLDIGADDTGKGLRAGIIVSDSHGKRLSSAVTTIPQRNAAMAASVIAGELANLLKTTIQPPPDARREATRFMAESQLLCRLGQYASAVRAAEAACALSPEVPQPRLELAIQLMVYALDTIEPGQINLHRVGGELTTPNRNIEQSLRLAGRSLELRIALWKSGSKVREMPLFQFSEFGQRLEQYENKLACATTKGVPADSASAYAAFLGARETLRDLRIGPPVKVTQGSIESLDARTEQVARQCAEMREIGKTNISPLSLPARKRLLLDWMGTLKEQGKIGTDYVFDDQFLRLTAIEQPALTPQVLDLLHELTQAMREHSNPLVSLNGQWQLLWVEFQQKRLDVPHCQQACVEMARQIGELIARPPSSRQEQYQRQCYRIFLYALDYLPHTSVRIQGEEHARMWDWMLTHDHLDRQIIEYATCKINAGWERENYPLWIPLMERTLKVLHKRDDQTVGSQLMQDELIACLAKARRDTDVQVENNSVPWTKATCLTSSLKEKGGYYRTSLVNGDVLYVPVCKTSGQTLSMAILRLNWKTDEARELGTISTRYVAGEHFSNIGGHLCMGDGQLFIGHAQDGIYAVALDGSGIKQIGSREGLPSTAVQSLAWLDGNLYAGLGGGYVVQYTPKTRSIRTIASARRQDRQTPLDGCEAFNVGWMQADPARERVLFSVTAFDPSAAAKPQMGIWQYKPADGSLKRVLKIAARCGITSAGANVGCRALLAAKDDCGHESAFWIDLATDTPELFYSSEPDDPLGPHPGLRRKQTSFAGHWPFQPPLILWDQWLWSGQKWARFRSGDADLDVLPPLVPGQFQAIEGLQWLDQSHILAASYQGLWVLELTNHK